MSLSEDLETEARLRMVEQRQLSHEARCDERYTQIRSDTTHLNERITALIAIMSKKFDMLLLALIILSISMALGPEIALRLFGPK